MSTNGTNGNSGSVYGSYYGYKIPRYSYVSDDQHQESYTDTDEFN